MEKPGQVALSGTITIPIESQGELLPLLEDHTRLTLAESGCISFAVTPDTANAEVFHVNELFQNEEAFDFHQMRGSASAWGKASAGLTRDFTKTVL